MSDGGGTMSSLGRAFVVGTFGTPRPPGAGGPVGLARQASWWAGTLTKWTALGVTRAPSAYYPTRWGLLTAALAAAPAEGLALEFGVFQGRSLNFLAGVAPGRSFAGFDSFEGLPTDWDDEKYRAGAFSLKGQLPAVGPNVTLVKGWFDRTLPGYLEAHPGPVAFLHVDCDLYSSARYVLEQLADRIVPGTIVVFDEFGGLLSAHEQRAFREVARGRRWRVRFLGYSGRGEVALAVRSTDEPGAPPAIRPATQ